MHAWRAAGLRSPAWSLNRAAIPGSMAGTVTAVNAGEAIAQWGTLGGAFAMLSSSLVVWSVAHGYARAKGPESRFWPRGPGAPDGRLGVQSVLRFGVDRRPREKVTE